MRTKLLTVSLGLSVISALAHPIDFNRIQNWTGTGPNQAALVIQYNSDAYGSDAYVWGYRWENGETPTGETMMKAICANSSRLSMLTQYTGSMGSTLCGVGYSLNQEVLKHLYFNFEKAKNFEYINFDYYNVNSFMGQTAAPGDNAPTLAQAAIDSAIVGTHYIQHPFDYGTYGYPAYDYDCWDVDSVAESRGGVSQYDLKWSAAWYEGYWSYWCANSQSQDWTYSGSGFSGRTLVDGSVDGWSFTQFETPQVGGTGEGVAPCEDGSIVYVPARLTDKEIAIAKCVRNVGEGESSIPMIVKFGNPSKIDNVVVKLSFNSTLPSAQVALAALAADPAFSLEGTKLSIDADGDGVFNNSGDDTCLEGNWTLTEYEDCVMLSCDNDQKPQYLFYLPAKDTVGAFLPDEMTFALSDETDYIPVFVQREATYDQINYVWYRRNDENLTHSNNSSDIVKSISSSTSTLGSLTYSGDKAGDVYIHARVRTGKGSSYSYSNVCHFKLLPPEIPIESITLANDSVDAPLNATIYNKISLSPENATFTGLAFKSSDTGVVTAGTTAIKTTKTPGRATVTISSKWDSQVSASFEVVSALRNPVTDFAIQGVDGDVIVLNPKQMLGIIADVTPADADIPDFNVALTGNGDDKSSLIASMYKVNYWDENNTRIQFYELSGHRAGQCTLTLTSTDGSNVTKVYTVKVEEQDRTPIEGGYVDGTLLLNEEWFGHTNGGMNYLTPQGDVMYQVYERENPGMSFGCTSQYAAIWGGKLIAISKQAADGGDPLPGGGRVVVADAKTLKRLGSIDDLMFGDESKSADGRAVAGATPGKVYVGTSNGIYVVDIEDVKVVGKISDLAESDAAEADLYSGQIGDMVHAGQYVFGIKQNTGAFAIDINTDKVVKKYDLTTVQGITQSADGHVWIASTVDGRARFTCVDPATLDEVEDMSVTLPSTVGYPTCSWGAWRNTQFVGSYGRNALWFSAGGGIAGGSSQDKYYVWEVGSSPDSVKVVFDMATANLVGSNKRVTQKTYGTLRYDDRSSQLIVMTTENSASGHYRYNWIHFINPETGEIARTIALRPYYWFQAFAIFPDKFDAVINLDDIEMDLADEDKIINLSELVTDADNINSNIKLLLYDTPAGVAQNDDSDAHATVSLEGKTMSISPKSVGKSYFTLAAESNGRTVSKTIAVNVSDVASGVNHVADGSRSVICDGQRMVISGFNGHEFNLYDIAGRHLSTFHVDSDRYVFDFGSHSGVYILNSDENISTKVVIRK